MKKALTLFLIIYLHVGCNNFKSKTEDSADKAIGAFTSDTISSHYLHELKFGQKISSSEQNWDRINGIVDLPDSVKQFKLDSNYRTFGWHLYSHGSAYKDYNFSLLWGVSYFAYIVNPENGSYKNIHQWKTSGIIDSAKAYNCKVFLTIANFGKENNAEFLNNEKSQKTLIDSILYLLSYRKANGINIDFESVSAECKEKFTTFVQHISQRLKQEDPKYEVSICLYAVDYNHIFNIKAIDPYIDFYTLMGYDYFGSFSSNAGPITPMRSSKDFGKNCLEVSVNTYISSGVTPSKLIVGLPYYGAEWVVNDTLLVSKSKKFISHLPYKTIKKEYIDSLHIPIQFDSLSLSSYCNYSVKGENRQLWFEDINSLAIKYKWIKSKKLGGVGIWALGFDNGNQELWDLLSNEFKQK